MHSNLNSDSPLVLALDAINSFNGLPKRFRYTSQPLPNDHTTLSELGLADLRAIASGQFSEYQLQHIIEIIDAPIFIVDLRQESHGFIDGNAISWYATRYNWSNIQLTEQQIINDEQTKLIELEKLEAIIVYNIMKSPEGIGIPTVPIILPAKAIHSEEKLTKKYQLGYSRLYLTDHCLAKPDQFNKLIQIIKNRPRDTWLYFHCRGGAGRSTFCMVVLDILINAKYVSLQDIIERHSMLGGANLNKLPLVNSYKYQEVFKRRLFLRKFYQNCL